MDQETHWETSSSWYDKIVGAKGHYYHEQVILPEVLKLLRTGPQKNLSVLDLACGQGVLARHLPKKMKYVGVDGSKSLIALAKQYAAKTPHEFLVKDLSFPLDLPYKEFSHACSILAVQNFADPTPVFEAAFSHLKKEGLFIAVLNHPCFRIPRQSSWGIDSPKKLQYRRIDRYYSSLKIPIQTHPGKGETAGGTWSFHQPISYYIKQLTGVGFVITGLEEWCSNRTSIGKAASMENKSRKEFPLFMTLVCKKI